MSKLSQTRTRIRGFEFSQQMEMVEVVHTIPQEERVRKRIPEQIVALTCHKWQKQIIKDSQKPRNTLRTRTSFKS